jgi:UDP-3-O-[3-hydroxymyristoyl] glucosamine N-acyltransferase
MTLNAIAGQVAGRVIGDPDTIITGVGPLESAAEGDITFAEKGPSLQKIANCRASAVLVPLDFSDSPRNLVQVNNPRLAFAAILSSFHPLKRPALGIHSSAVIGEGCRLGKEICIGAGTVLGDRVTIGDNVWLHPLVVIGDDAAIGNDTIIYPHVVILERCRIGQRVIIHAGTVIGSDGYGFVQDGGRHLKIPQTGIVRIDDDVELGAGNTVDRATFGETWIQEGVKTDNQVHVAHNVVVGAHTLLVAQVGIAGSTTIGRHAILAGQAGIAGHIDIGDGVIVGPKTGVAHSLPAKQIVSGGVAAMPHRTWLRVQHIIPNLPEMAKQIRELEKRISELERAASPKS